MIGMGELERWLAETTLAEEATSSGTADVLVPVDCQLEAVGLMVVTKLGNTITTASGIDVVRLSGVALATSTTLCSIDFSAASTSTLGFKFGASGKVGQTTILGTYTFDVGEVIVKKLTTTGENAKQLKAGDRVRFQGSTTGGSATGDFRPFVLVRVSGVDLTSTRVASDYEGVGVISNAVDS